jgi:ABC-2 type transport system ATP-binding protein
MDDPAMGLDPVARRTLLEAMILVTRKEGHTIFFTSHEIADVERVADHIAIMDQSVLRVAAPVDVFRSRVRKLAMSFASFAPQPPLTIRGLLQVRRDDRELTLTLVDSDEPADRAAVDAALSALGATSMRELALPLEDAVVAFLGHREVHGSLLDQEAPK